MFDPVIIFSPFQNRRRAHSSVNPNLDQYLDRQSCESRDPKQALSMVTSFDQTYQPTGLLRYFYVVFRHIEGLEVEHLPRGIIDTSFRPSSRLGV